MARAIYPSDLTDGQWGLIEPHIPPERWGGRTRSVDMREVLDGILYLVRNGCAWRAIPHDLANWSTCRCYYDRFRRDGTWAVIHKLLRDRVRERAGRAKEPSAAVLDAQSVKCGGKGGRTGYDAGKKVKGRKRHLVVDTLGLVRIAVVHSAGLQDDQPMAAGQVFQRLFDLGWSRLKRIWADQMYEGSAVLWARAVGGWALQVVRRVPGQKGFAVLPRRWVVERTFAWLGRYRRLSKDYETETINSETMIYLAMINLMVHRLEPG